MPRYGDLDALNMRLADEQLANRGWRDDYCEILDDIMDLVDEQPTADVVEVVRCKDCEYWRNPRVSKYDGLVRGECYHEECGGVWENGYCSDGKRRNDGTQI